MIRKYTKTHKTPIRKKPNYREDAELEAVFDWARHYEILRKHMFHIPNERNTSWFMGKKNKAKGVLSGVSDIFLSFPAKGYHGLYIEAKGPKRTKGYKPAPVSDAQIEFIKNMLAAGYCAVVKYGSIEIIETVCDYLGEYLHSPRSIVDIRQKKYH